MSAPKLDRIAFKTSRLLDFCSKTELAKQVGCDVENWPLVILKELLDNAIDAAEEAGVAPVVTVEVAGGAIIIADNGPGIPPEVVASILDYASRTSSREAYVSPTRGQQGNALQTILAMGYVLDGDEVGETIIESREVAHHIRFRADPIRSQPMIDRSQEPSEVKIGTKLTVRWPVSASSILDNAKARFLLLAEGFGWFNPHLDLTVDWDGEHIACSPSKPMDWDKWRPSDPTSAHWYNEARLRRLMAAQIADGQDHNREPRYVRPFVGEFRGLSGSAKQSAVLEAVGAARMTLPDFFESGSVADLLAAMQAKSSPVPPKGLGEIGKDHLAACFKASGVDLATFQYKRIYGQSEGLPYVVEAAFGYRPKGEGQVIVSGVNWSPAILNPFRQLRTYESLDTILAEQRCGRSEPLAFALHLSCPLPGFVDHGKGTIALDWRVAKDAKEAVLAITKKWRQQRKSEERDASARANRLARLVQARDRVTVKDAAYAIMEKAYLKASANGTLPANARQVMYAARAHIQQETGEQLDAQYFTQQLLPDYMNEHEVDWDVVFDDRGHFREPHTRRRFGLGGIAVRNYLAGIGGPSSSEAEFSSASISTHGPSGCYSAVMFCEKEGFDPLFEAVKLAERFDISIMSTKGMSVTAARKLIDKLAGLCVRVFVLHDFDKAGLSIIGTLRRDTRRYTFENQVDIVDLGLRLDDVMELGLADQRESVFDRGDDDAKRENLRLNGASELEIEFLLQHRVELNALSSAELVAFIERKLGEHGVEKVVPSQKLLETAYQLFARSWRIKKIVEDALAKDTGGPDVEPPSDLAERVRAYLAKYPKVRWIDAVSVLTRINAPSEDADLDEDEDDDD